MNRILFFLSFDQCAQAIVAQVEPSPEQYSDQDREHHGEDRIADTHMAGDSAAQIASQQNRAENRRARKYVDGNAKKLNDAERDGKAEGKSKLMERVKRRAPGPLRAWLRPAA